MQIVLNKMSLALFYACLQIKIANPAFFNPGIFYVICLLYSEYKKQGNSKKLLLASTSNSGITYASRRNTIFIGIEPEHFSALQLIVNK
jgi:hypothetical protein